jgi:tRNA-2-methylthio-N6-dimethylallyladenosine synthase
MHRPYTAEKYLRLVERIRQARLDVALTTDVIVGFPGEEENDYAQTRELVERIQFDNAFIFRYSPRAETPAATAAEQLPEAVKEQRNQDLLRVVDAAARRANERLVGRTVEVLCEGVSPRNATRLMGRTRTNKVVVFENKGDRAGELLQIQIEQANGFSLYGTPVV